jgi:threonine dehydrogenase-like Zn-dependent dehydrogenase
MADYFAAPQRNLFAVPDGVDDRTAALVECLATPVHAVRIAGEVAGARVVVLGAGTIGLLCVVAALHAGAATSSSPIWIPASSSGPSGPVRTAPFRPAAGT